ncbi:polymorphic toxin type 15 domain-containing protein [Rossellomorea marisflavi]|nr:polymorphic toxin type 15 domain-containing protein [Rossellomorea marisflavi]
MKVTLHNPDQITGGKAEVRDKRIHSSIGSQWRMNKSRN